MHCLPETKPLRSDKKLSVARRTRRSETVVAQGVQGIETTIDRRTGFEYDVQLSDRTLTNLQFFRTFGHYLAERWINIL
jgi:hypothetical protein